MGYKEYNFELQRKYREPNLIKVVKTSQLRQLGQTFRYNNNNPIKQITSLKSEGKGRTGRPRRRWLNNIKKYLRNINVNKWKTIAIERSKWFKLR